LKKYSSYSAALSNCYNKDLSSEAFQVAFEPGFFMLSCAFSK